VLAYMKRGRHGAPGDLDVVDATSGLTEEVALRPGSPGANKGAR
jgi:hypothetical protein